ncbi:MAG: hypothetical protein ACJAT2_003441 [Bacteriovoracaceae bacterium]|jgi:uncharacterized protein (TIGR02285 family)
MFKKYTYLLSILFLLSSPSLAKPPKEKPSINWLMINYAPYYINDGPLKEKGVHDKIANFFIDSLLDYNHKILQVNAPRLFQSLKKNDGKLYCSPGLGGKPLASHLNYSSPMFLGPAPGLVVLKNGPFKELKDVNLTKIIHSMNVKIGKPDQGTYGPKLQDIFDKNPTKFININNSDSRVGNSMVIKKRIDGFISYSLAFRFYQKQMKAGDSLKFLPINEHDKFTPSHSLCTDSKLGREVVGKINLLMKKKTYKAVVKESMMDFMPESLQEEFLKVNKL